MRSGRSRRQAVSTYLLKALAVSDNVFLATAAAVQMYPAMATVAGQSAHLHRIYPYYQILAWPLAHIVQLVSVWMMVLVAGNRYVAVCRSSRKSGPGPETVNKWWPSVGRSTRPRCARAAWFAGRSSPWLLRVWSTVCREEGRPACKNRVVRCWCGYLSGARCRFAYGPADATATHCLLLQ